MNVLNFARKKKWNITRFIVMLSIDIITIKYNVCYALSRYTINTYIIE